MITITTQQGLVDFFNKFKAPVRAQVVTRTPVRMNKRDVATKTIDNPFYGRVFKVQVVEVELNADYEGKVNNARVLEGKATDFEAEQLKWGVALNGSIVQKEETLYLKTLDPKKIGNEIYEMDGNPVDYATFAAYVPAYSGSIKQELEDEVKVRTFKLDNVIGINVDGKVRYTVATK